MLVKELWKSFLSELKKKQKNKRYSFKDAKGQVWGIDISVWLHSIASTAGVAMYLAFDEDNVPKAVEDAFINVIKSRIRIAEKYAIKLIFVFDGAQHELKAVARANRDNAANKARQKITAFEEKCNNTPQDVNDEDRDSYVKNLKKISRPRQEITHFIVEWMKSQNISFVSAPYEAEWQLVRLEADNDIHAVASIDGDCVVLGAKRVIYYIDWAKQKYEMFDQEEVLRSKDDLLAEYDPQYWPIIASLLGTDYVKNIKGIGIETVKDHIKEMKRANDWSNEKIMSIMALRPKAKTEVGHWNTFKFSTNLLRHCPVLDGGGNLVPLNPIPGIDFGTNSGADIGSAWKSYIGFDPFSELPIGKDTYKAAAKFDNCSFQNARGDPLKSFDYQRYTQGHTNIADIIGRELPPFATTCREFVMMPDFVLRCYLTARTGRDTAYESREDLVEHARLVRERNDPIKPPDSIPKQDSHWIITEVLSIIDDAPDWDSITGVSNFTRPGPCTPDWR